MMTSSEVFSLASGPLNLTQRWSQERILRWLYLRFDQ